MKTIRLFILVSLTFLICPLAKAQESQTTGQGITKLTVLWYSDDPMVAERVAFMYTHFAKKMNMFDEVGIIIWGPSAKLAVENKDIRAKLKEMMDDGIKVEACIACAHMYGVIDQLKEMGITVEPMVAPLTNALKSENTKVLSF